MQIQEFQVENFRSISSQELDLGQFNVLIGKNNAGKSNLTKSLQAYIDLFCGRKPPQEIHEEAVTRGRESSPIEFEVEFTVSDDLRSAIVEEIASDHQLPADTYDTFSDDNSFSIFEHEISLRETGISRNTIRTQIDGERIEVGTISGGSGTYTIEVIDLDTLPDYERNTTTHHGQSPGVIHILPDSIYSKISDSLSNVQIVSPFREPSDRGTFGAETVLDPSGNNLTTVLHALRDDGTDRYELIRETYTDVMEGVTGLRVSVEEAPPEADRETIPQIRIDEKSSKDIALDEISSGSKEILMLITKIVTSVTEAPLLFIEEPELHLHPAAEREIYNLIREKIRSSGTQTVLTTHSDIFVDEVDVENIFSVKRDGDTTVETVEKGTLGEELASLGYSKSEFIQADRVIFVEGRSDGAIFKNWANTLGKSFAEYGVHTIVYNGDELFEEGNPYAKEVPSVLSQLSIPYLYIFDSDGRERREKREEIVGKLSESPSNIHILEQHSIESYLCQSPRAIHEGAGIEQTTIEEELPNVPENKKMKSHLNDLFKDELDTGYSEESHGAIIANQMREDEIPDEMAELIDEITTMEGR